MYSLSLSFYPKCGSTLIHSVPQYVVARVLHNYIPGSQGTVFPLDGVHLFSVGI
ncbi:hypothetical protein D3C75_1336060 [compost metagenome]